ncbi:glycosyltransferase involved in cell wall biosynthesis [Paraburkholderia sp. GAS199]|uniref:glycosyltransferase family 2 protein n=1 Tax=Paraburkholderia sp. GAS199 TaxID=3035126 RepID=UPI003D259861
MTVLESQSIIDHDHASCVGRGPSLPLVSIYIPTKNRLALLQRAVESVFQQTYPNIELIVTDDGSTDGSRDYLASLANQGRLKAIFMPQSGGACAARNAAIEMSTGEFVTGLDDDDHLLAFRIEQFVERWQALDISSDDRIAGLFSAAVRVSKKDEIVVFGSALRVASETLRLGNSIGNQVFAPRENFLDAGLFDVTLACWQDWDMWLRMSERHGDFIGNPEPSYVWDIAHEQGRISDQAEQRIRVGSARFAEKHGFRSHAESAVIVVSLAGYKAVQLSLRECAVLIRSGNGATLVAHELRRLFGETAFVRFWKLFRMFKTIGRKKSVALAT